MTIKEIELRSGLSRANVRFYEKEGFLSPERHENGYRDYTEEDLTVLKKIRLLRMLHIPLSEIKGLLDDSQTFLQVMENHIAFLDQEIQNYQDAKAMCHRMM
ncbi:MAG: MerR family transcriptional regulator, partial [Firmicutes bacterium]|nr:MerR family transcriptional regulator [Bacillota bacterium]